jgi:hypothetical protein
MRKRVVAAPNGFPGLPRSGAGGREKTIDCSLRQVHEKIESIDNRDNLMLQTERNIFDKKQ